MKEITTIVKLVGNGITKPHFGTIESAKFVIKSAATHENTFAIINEIIGYNMAKAFDIELPHYELAKITNTTIIPNMNVDSELLALDSICFCTEYKRSFPLVSFEQIQTISAQDLSKSILHRSLAKTHRLSDDERLAIISESIPEHFDIRRNFKRPGNYDRQNFDYYIRGISFEQEIGIKIIKKNTPFTTLQSLRMFMIDNPHLKATILFDNQDVVEADTYLYIKDVIDKLDNVKITDNPREVMW